MGSIGRQGHPELGKLKFPVPARTFRYSGITGGPGEKVHTSPFQGGFVARNNNRSSHSSRCTVVVAADGN